MFRSCPVTKCISYQFPVHYEWGSLLYKVMKLHLKILADFRPLQLDAENLEFLFHSSWSCFVYYRVFDGLIKKIHWVSEVHCTESQMHCKNMLHLSTCWYVLSWIPREWSEITKSSTVLLSWSKLHDDIRFLSNMVTWETDWNCPWIKKKILLENLIP